MKKTFAIIFSLSTMVLAGCTLTPPKGGDDLLDTGHKTEHQDPVVPPSGPYTATIPAHFIAEKKVVPAASKPAKLTPDVKAEKKSETEVKIEPKLAPEQVSKPEEKIQPKAEVKEEVKPAPVPAPEAKKDAVVIPNEIKTQPRSAVAFVEAKPPTKPVEATPAVITETKAEVKENAAASPSCVAKLKSGDKIQINVTKEKDLTGSYTLDQEGNITYPLLGKIAAQDMTPAQLQEVITARLANGYLVKPEVRVESSSACHH